MKISTDSGLLAGLFDVVAAFIGLVFLGGLLAVLIALPVMFFWNEVVPDIFGLKTISFTQALMLSGLTSCLFKSSIGSSSK